MPDWNDFDGKVAIVTGSGGGIGRAEAMRLAAGGAAVLVNDVDAAAASAVADEIRDNGGRATFVVGDASDWSVGNELVERAIGEWAQLDILVNNAGIARPRMIFNMSEDEFDSVIRIHIKGSFVATRAAAIHWRERAKQGETNDASVIMTTSINGLRGVPGHVNYVFAKAGIAGVTTSLAPELAPYGVRVNAIAPIAFTSMTSSLWGSAGFTDDRRDALAPEQVAEVVGWLCSARSKPLTGQVVSFSGASLSVFENWHPRSTATAEGLWSFDTLDAARPTLFDDTADVASTSE